ncbi:unnamed protein product, partial [Aphanomyces euteiches]
MQSFSLGGHDVRFEQPEDNTDSQEFEDASMDGGNADSVGEEEIQEDFDDVSMHGDDEENNCTSRRDHETPTPRPAPVKRADRSTSLEDMTEHRDNKRYHQIPRAAPQHPRPSAEKRTGRSASLEQMTEQRQPKRQSPHQEDDFNLSDEVEESESSDTDDEEFVAPDT